MLDGRLLRLAHSGAIERHTLLAQVEDRHHMLGGVLDRLVWDAAHGDQVVEVVLDELDDGRHAHRTVGILVVGAAVVVPG